MGKTGWDKVYVYLEKAAEKGNTIEKRLELVKEGIEYAKKYGLGREAIRDLEKWKEHLELFLKDTPDDIFKKWYDVSEKNEDGYTSGRKIREVYRAAYKNPGNYILINKELTAAAMPGLNLSERLKLINEMIEILNTNWRKNPDIIMSNLDSLEKLKKHLENFADTNMKEKLNYYGEIYNFNNKINKIYLVAFEEYLTCKEKSPEPKEMSREELLEFLEKQIELLKKKE